MRLLALCLVGWIVSSCGCSPHTQQIVSGFGVGQDGAAQRPSEPGKKTGHILQVAHFNQEKAASELPLASDAAKAQAFKKLIGLDLSPEPSFAGPYRSMTAAQCRCRAAQASTTAKLLESEAGLSGHGKKGDMRQALLNASAEEARNKDAAAALELFYRLAEAEARWVVLAASIEQVQKANTHADKLKEQGLPLPTDIDQFRRQDFDLRSDRVRLSGGIEQLNRNLARRVEVEGVPDEERLWPIADFSVPEEPVDVAAAVELGLGQRAELQFLRQAGQDASLANLSELRKTLSASNALLGMTGGPCKKVIAVLCKSETSNRRQQMEQLEKQREKEIADDIRQAAQDMNAQLQLITIARARSKNAAATLKEQQNRLDKGIGSVFDVTSARLTSFKAHDQQVREVTAWYIARTKLQETQGGLTQGCDPHADLLSSYPPHLEAPQEFPPMEAKVLPPYRRTYTER